MLQHTPLKRLGEPEDVDPATLSLKLEALQQLTYLGQRQYVGMKGLTGGAARRLEDHQ